MVGKDPEDVSELSSLAEPLALVDVLLASEKKKCNMKKKKYFLRYYFYQLFDDSHYNTLPYFHVNYQVYTVHSTNFLD